MDQNCTHWSEYFGEDTGWINLTNPINISLGVCPWNESFPTNTTADDAFNLGSVLEVTLEVGITSIVIFLLIALCMMCRKYRNKQEQASWEYLGDFDEMRSNFKSAESIKIFISGQTLSSKMVISLIFLVIAIGINTFTNVRGWWRYRDDIIHDDLDSMIIGWNATRLLAFLELLITFVMMMMVVLMALVKEYEGSITILIAYVPSISAMVYFCFLNTQQAKGLICNEWADKTHTIRRRICGTMAWILMVLAMGLVGMWVFVVKINQISYIYTKNISDLDRGDFIIVLGVARQFAGLYSMHSGFDCFSYPGVTVHPSYTDEEAKDSDNDPKIHYRINAMVCYEAIRVGAFHNLNYTP